MQLRTNILHYPLPGVLLSGIADCSQKNVPFRYSSAVNPSSLFFFFAHWWEGGRYQDQCSLSAKTKNTERQYSECCRWQNRLLFWFSEEWFIAGNIVFLWTSCTKCRLLETLWCPMSCRSYYSLRRLGGYSTLLLAARSWVRLPIAFRWKQNARPLVYRTKLCMHV